MEKNRYFKTGFLGEKREKSEIVGQKPFWAFLQNKSTKTRATKNKKKQTKKKHFLHFGKQPVFRNFFQVALFHVCKVVFTENVMKIVCSTEQLLCITDSKTPFRSETPILVVFGDFVWSQKKK